MKQEDELGNYLKNCVRIGINEAVTKLEKTLNAERKKSKAKDADLKAKDADLKAKDADLKVVEAQNTKLEANLKAALAHIAELEKNRKK